MPANLATTDSKPAMMYAGEVPWHRLGTRLDSPATAREAIVASGLDYRVAIKPLVTLEGTDVPQRKAVVRHDTGDVLGVVGNSYVPVQNHQAFGFLDAVVADEGLRYHTAGALGKGERIWMLARLPGSIRVGNSDDLVDKFLLLSNTHDGTTALRVFFTPIRVVCQNTLNLAERNAGQQGIAIMHVSRRSKPASDRRVMSGHLPGAIRPTGHPTALPPEESCDGECVEDGDYRGDSFVAIGRTVLPRDRATTWDPSGDGGSSRSAWA